MPNGRWGSAARSGGRTARRISTGTWRRTRPTRRGMPGHRHRAGEPVMPRKLKTYQTSLGFYDLAIAAPSMKAALEAWGAGSNLFHQGAARETDDPDVVTATMSKPGVVLKRAAGSSARFAEHADLSNPWMPSVPGSSSSL